MRIVCLDLEGVLVPEIWIEFAERTGIPELRRTTRDEPNYDTLMKQLGWPTLFCHRLEADANGVLVDYHLRMPDQKREAVKRFKELNLKVVAAGLHLRSEPCTRSAVEIAMHLGPFEKIAALAHGAEFGDIDEMVFTPVLLAGARGTGRV